MQSPTNFFMNNEDIILMDHQESHYLDMGFGVIDSTIKSQSQLPAQNQNASLRNALTQDDILEPFQYSSGTLDSKDLPNQASTSTTVYSHAPFPCTKNMDTSISDEHIARIQANLEDPTSDISLFKTYINQEGEMADAHPIVEQNLEDLYNVLVNEQNVFGVLDSTINSKNQSPALNHNTSHSKVLTQDDIRVTFGYCSGILDSNDVPNQAVSDVSSQAPVPCTQNMDSSISDEHIARIKATLEDPIADISLFKKYCRQDGEMTNDHPTAEQNLEDLYNVLVNEQNVMVEVSKNQEIQDVSSDSVDDAQIPLTVYDMTQDDILQPNAKFSITTNTVNQSGGGQVVVNFVTSNLLTMQTDTQSPIIQDISEDECQFIQFVEAQPVPNTPAALEDNMHCQNTIVRLNSNHQFPQLIDSKPSTSSYVAVDGNIPCQSTTVMLNSSNQFPQLIDSKPSTSSYVDVDGKIPNQSTKVMLNLPNQFPQSIESKPAANIPATLKDKTPCQSSMVMVNPIDLTNVASAINPNVIHVTWPNLTGFSNQESALTPKPSGAYKQNTGPMKTKTNRNGKVGRCPQGVLPLYLQAEPENEQERKRWYRAKTTRGHRESKKNALANAENKIKEQAKHIDELKNQLSIANAKIDTLDKVLENIQPRFS